MRGVFLPKTIVLALLALPGVCPSKSYAQPLPDYGHTFVTVGAAGNREATAAERNNAFDQDLNYGSVGYEYRITQTEVTASQWLEFVRAYAPFHAGAPNDPLLTGNYIDYMGNGQYVGGGAIPTDAGWHYAARYVNWLCNGKVSAAWAFESGAYGTATFTTNPDGTRNDQVTRSPGATFWIPSFEETYKAFYYDPNRYGPQMGGYWLYPNASNSIPISGPPGVGTTNTGTLPGEYWAAGSYPNAQTPWGLLDASGGGEEMTDTTDPEGLNIFRRRYRLGTSIFMNDVEIQFRDAADVLYFQIDPPEGRSFRVASMVPSPAPCAAFLIVGVTAIWRRRR